jgi:CheY-like chemotaxis protein
VGRAAKDGWAALAMMQQAWVQPDLVVTEVIMPPRNGRQLYTEW